MTMRRIGLVLVCAMAFGGVAETTTATVSTAAPSYLKDANAAVSVLTVALDNSPNFDIVEPNGSITGFLPNLISDITAKIGIKKIHYIQTTYDAMIPGLIAGRWDIALALTLSTPRCQEASFGDPNVVYVSSFAVKPGNPDHITSYESFKQNHKLTLAVGPGTFEDNYATSVGIPTSQLVLVPDPVTGVDAVRSGRADAYAGADLTIETIPGKGFEMITAQGAPSEGTGFAFGKSEGALKSQFNTSQIALEHNGVFLALSKRWGFNGPAAIATTDAKLGKGC